MKDILFMMQQSCSKSSKQLLILYPVICIITLFMLLLFSQNRIILDFIMFFAIIAMMNLNIKRVKTFIQVGAFKRIRLLPVKPYAFVLSEILFSYATYASLFVCIYFTWFFYAYVVLQVPDYNTFIITTLSMPSLDFLFIDHMGDLYFMLAYILMISIQTFASSVCLSLNKTQTSFFISIYISFQLIFGTERMSSIKMILFFILFIIVVLYDMGHIMKSLKLDRKKVAS